MWSSSNRDRCRRRVLLTVVVILCISFVFLSLTHIGAEKQVIMKNLNGNSLSSERLIKEKCIPVCDSKHCVFQANLLLKSINPEVDPCENFQKFLCGEFEQRFGPNDHGFSGISSAYLTMLNKVKDAIENSDSPPGSVSSKLKIMYDSCVNIGSSDLRGVEAFKQFLADAGISNWPYLTADFTFSEDGLPVLLGTLKAHLEVLFLAFLSITEYMENPNETYVEVFFHHDFLDFPPIQRDAAADVLKYFDHGTEDIELILNDYYNVKDNLSILYNGTTCEEECKVMNIDCLSTGDDDWVFLCKTLDVFLNITHLSDFITKPGISINEGNFLSVKRLVSTLMSLPNRSVANFFALRLLWDHLDEVNLFFRLKKQKYYEYFKTIYTKKPEMVIKDRWLACLEWMSDNMKLPLENIYVEKYIGKSTIDEIHDMHVNYTSEIAGMLYQQKWIPATIRYGMENWIRNLKNTFSQLQELLPNDTLVNEYMKLFNPTPESFILNVFQDRKSKIRAHYLHKMDPNMEHTPSFKVNAAFNEDGEIAYHYGIIFPPFHYPGHIRLINRILFAPIVVHEVGHGVVRFLLEISESAKSIKETFLEKKLCIENQFSKFKFKYLGENLNGTQYYEENLSDNLAQAFLDKLLENFESSEDVISLPGLQYSPKQQLYMSSGEGFCSKSDLKMDIHFKTQDVHAPLEYRIIGTMQNSRAYADAFHCPAGSYMNPTIKCSLLD